MGKGERVRILADRYEAITGKHVYAGCEPIGQGRHYFSDGTVIGDDAAYEHMVRLCQLAGIEV
jgi:hypothetical protein